MSDVDTTICVYVSVESSAFTQFSIIVQKCVQNTVNPACQVLFDDILVSNYVILNDMDDESLALRMDDECHLHCNNDIPALLYRSVSKTQ